MLVASKSLRLVSKLDKAPQHVKIIAGQWRGTKLPVLPKEGVRPTSNRVRETLFNWLQASIEGSHCLDMFAGSGALGFEAVSRGACSATLVDNDPSITEVLADQAKRLQANNIEIVCVDSLQFCLQARTQYDFIFIDPPFSRFNLAEILEKISHSNILKDSTLIYIEGPADHLPEQLPADWHWKRQSKAGDVEYGLIRTS